MYTLDFSWLPRLRDPRIILLGVEDIREMIYAQAILSISHDL